MLLLLGHAAAARGVCRQFPARTLECRTPLHSKPGPGYAHRVLGRGPLSEEVRQ